MARTYSSVTFFCKNDCGSEITFRRDDHLPHGEWECEACLDAATEQPIDELYRAAHAQPRPILRCGFAPEWPRKVDFN